MPYRNFAERTREEYQNDLTDFIEFAEKSGVSRANRVGLPIVMRFIAGLEHKGFSSLTRKRKVVTIRSFFSFLYRDGYIRNDIASKVVLPFTETTTPHILTQVECDRLREACAGNPRDKAIIEILLETGIKLSELTQLTLNDIDLEKTDGGGEKQSGFIRVLGNRSKKERMIPLSKRANLAIQNYLKVREKAGINILFLNRFNVPVSDRGVQKMLRKYLKSAGIGNASIHTLRHTFGAYSLARGMSIKAVKELMGSRDSRSITIYRSIAQSIAT
jgi:site-specific recombinase XerD